MTNARAFHTYSRKRLDPYADPTRNFYVLSSSYAYGGGCGGEGAGIETFPHMLAALESQFSWLLDFDEDHFEAAELKRERESLEQCIAEIESKGTDEGITPSCLSIDGDRVGYSTLASGYWCDFVHEALRVFADDIQCRLDDADGADEEDQDEWKQELARLEGLMKRQDTESESFVGEFLELASDYGERHC